MLISAAFSAQKMSEFSIIFIVFPQKLTSDKAPPKEPDRSKSRLRRKIADCQWYVSKNNIPRYRKKGKKNLWIFRRKSQIRIKTPWYS
jgi:hypothetical protein